MKSPITLGIIPNKNLRSHPVRTVILLMLTMAQAVCVFLGLILTQSMRQEMSLAEARLGADILIYPYAAMSKISSKTLLMQGTPVQVWKDRSILSRITECKGIRTLSYQIYIMDTTGDKPIWITGFDPETDFVITAWTDAPAAFELADGEVLAGCKVAADENNTVMLFHKRWTIAARLAETGSELDETVFASFQTMRSLITASKEAGITTYQSVDPDEDFTAALVQVNDKSELDSITSWLNVYIRKIQAVRSEETLADTAVGIRSQLGLIAVIIGAAWAVLLAALGIAQSMMMKERRKELYIWHTVGASRGIVYRVMLQEALIIHASGAIIGVLPTAVLSAALFSGAKGVTPIPLASYIIWSVATVCLSALIGCLSTLWAIRRNSAALNSQMLLSV